MARSLQGRKFRIIIIADINNNNNILVIKLITA